MSKAHRQAPSRRKQGPRASVTTAAGIAAERETLADRERERRTTRARTAARALEGNAADRGAGAQRSRRRG
jgi:hypothetical protein